MHVAQVAILLAGLAWRQSLALPLGLLPLQIKSCGFLQA